MYNFSMCLMQTFLPVGLIMLVNCRTSVAIKGQLFQFQNGGPIKMEDDLIS